MHALNIMWLLNDVTCNTQIEVNYTRTKSCDFITIETNDFTFTSDEYGGCKLTYKGEVDYQKDKDAYTRVLNWVKKYFSEII